MRNLSLGSWAVMAALLAAGVLCLAPAFGADTPIVVINTTTGRQQQAQAADNATAAGGVKVSAGASKNQALSVGLPTSFTDGTLNTSSVFYADNSNWGHPATFISDSIGRGPLFASQGFSTSGNTGTGIYFSLTSGSVSDLYAYAAGTSNVIGTFNIQAKALGLPINSGAVGLSVANTTDATAIGSASVILSGGLSVAKSEFLGGNLVIAVAGKELKIKEGTNAAMGTATLVAGSSVVSNTLVTATSRVMLTSQVDGGTPGFLRVSTRTAGTSFTITSSSGTDTSTVAWCILEPAP